MMGDFDFFLALTVVHRFMEELGEFRPDGDIEEGGCLLLLIVEEFPQIGIDQDDVKIPVQDEKTLLHRIDDEAQLLLLLCQGLNFVLDEALGLVDLIGEGFDFNLPGQLFLADDLGETVDLTLQRLERLVDGIIVDEDGYGKDKNEDADRDGDG